MTPVVVIETVVFRKGRTAQEVGQVLCSIIDNI